jgi:hypothetical protein
MSELTKNEKLLVEEIKVIQDVIKRMASNSFSVKTWTITLIVATLLFKGSNNHIFIAFIPLIAFWFLDSYYLKQERLFREVHNWITRYRLENDDKLFNLNSTPFNDKVQSVFRIMFSVSTLPFYGSIFIMLIGYISIVYWDKIGAIVDCLQVCLGGK